MTLYTSTQFASAAANGTDWRDISKKVLEALSGARTPGDGFNIGFLYISDLLSDDAQSILSLFKSVTGIETWIGSCGMGVAGVGQAFVDQPAISAMIGHVDDGKFKTFFAESTPATEVRKEIRPWLDNHAPMLVVLHGNSISERNPDFSIGLIAQQIGGFVAGGLTSARDKHVHFATEAREEGFSGVAFSADVPVSAAMSQGCTPISDVMTVTRTDGQLVLEIDGRKPFDVFTDVLKKMTIERIGKNPDEIFVQAAGGREGIEIPDEFKNIFKGEVHIALPVAGSDTQDYMVRDIIGLDPDGGVMAVTQKMEPGDRLMFVHRDDSTVRADLSHMLVNLRRRVTHDQDGDFRPKAALYFTCIARAGKPFTEDGRDELALVRDIIGDVPLTGFYANGEISGGRHYRYTGVLVLFL